MLEEDIVLYNRRTTHRKRIENIHTGKVEVKITTYFTILFHVEPQKKEK